MKSNRIGRGLKATAVSLALGLGITACSRDYTVAYLYVTSATKTTTGVINAYAVDYQSGALEQLSDSPIPAGNNPVALVASPDAHNLYVVNRNDSNLIHYAIGTDGKLYAQATTSVVGGSTGGNGSFPVAAAIDPFGNYLYVLFTFQNGFTPARTGPGGIAVFKITHTSDPSTDGALSAPLAGPGGLPYFPLGNNPTALTISPKGGYVYVVDREFTAANVPFGIMIAFKADTGTAAAPGTGTLTQIPNTSPIPAGGALAGGFPVGASPSSIVEEPAGLYVYITDSNTNQLFALQTNSAGYPQFPDHLAVPDRALSGECHGRSARTVPLRGQLRLQHGFRLHDHERLAVVGCRLGRRGYRPQLRHDRARARHLPLHFQPDRQLGLRRAARSALRLVEKCAGNPVCRSPAPYLRGRSSQRSPRNADRPLKSTQQTAKVRAQARTFLLLSAVQDLHLLLTFREFYRSSLIDACTFSTLPDARLPTSKSSSSPTPPRSALLST